MQASPRPIRPMSSRSRSREPISSTISGGIGSPTSTRCQAKNLLDDVLFQYRERAGVMPDRVVIHKTTTYQPEEIAGFKAAGKDHVAVLDYLWMRSTAFRMVRKGVEEPWRGTLCLLKDQSYLFTGGYVPWWNEYPGMHIPAPLELGTALPTDMKEPRARNPYPDKDELEFERRHLARTNHHLICPPRRRTHVRAF